VARDIRSSTARADFFTNGPDMRQSLDRLIRDESGQDLIEYGLLASIISIAGVLLFPSIKTAMDTTFGNWGTKVYNLWKPNEPGS
jgi:Flp pilus assembly pilin Flp